jgi:hypothetical protein
LTLFSEDAILSNDVSRLALSLNVLCWLFSKDVVLQNILETTHLYELDCLTVQSMRSR